MTQKTLFSALALSVLVFSSSSVWASSLAVDAAGQPKAPPSSPAVGPEASKAYVELLDDELTARNREPGYGPTNDAQAERRVARKAARDAEIDAMFAELAAEEAAEAAAAEQK